MVLWMVRTGRHGEHESLCLEKGIVAIGFDEIPDISKIKSKDELKDLLEDIFQHEKPGAIINWTGQVWSFKENIKIGDLVILPLKTRSAIAIGEVKGNYEYHPDFPIGAHHTRTVKWIKTDVPRSDLKQDLLYSLGAFMTVCRIKRNNAETRIQEILKGKKDSGYELESIVEDEDDEEVETGEDHLASIDIEQYSQDHIRTHIETKFRGHELSRLVTALLNAQDYHSQMSSPGPDGGVDIIAGKGPMGFDYPRLIVQVKSGSSPVDVNVLRELQGVMKNFGAQQGLLVSWAGFKKTVYDEARRHFFEIRLWDAGNLIEALLSNYEALTADIQAELPLKRIWVLVQEE